MTRTDEFIQPASARLHAGLPDPPALRRDTLLARRETRDGAAVYVFDICLQGAGETVFFDV